MNPFKLKKPYALQMREFSPDAKGYCWEDWHRDAKNDFPIRYFLTETLTLWFSVNIYLNITNFIYWIKSNTYKKIHFLDLRQPKTNTTDDYRWGYLDCSDVILYACFNSLCTYVDDLDKGPGYNLSEIIENIKKELLELGGEDHLVKTLKNHEDLLELHKYWTIDRKESLLNIDSLSREDRKIFIAQDKFEAEETERLITLIRIRRNMWS